MVGRNSEKNLCPTFELPQHQRLAAHESRGLHDRDGRPFDQRPFDQRPFDNGAAALWMTALRGPAHDLTG